MMKEWGWWRRRLMGSVGYGVVIILGWIRVGIEENVVSMGRECEERF